MKNLASNRLLPGSMTLWSVDFSFDMVIIFFRCESINRDSN